MNTNKTSARAVGILFIVATAAGIASLAFSPVLEGPEYLANIAASESLPMASLLILVMVAAGVGIGALMFPVLKRHNEGLALGYTSIKIIEATFTLVAQAALLALWPLSQTAALDPRAAQTMGSSWLAAHDAALLVGVSLVFPLGALLLNGLLFQARLIPRWLSAWGMAGAALYLVYGLLAMFDRLPPSISAEFIWAVPIAIQEMALALWLIIRGFSPPVSVGSTAVTESGDLIAAH